MYIRVIVTMIWLVLLAAAADLAIATPNVNASRHCSSHTLRGSYGYNGGGKMGTIEFFSIGTATFDGVGNFTWTSSDFPGELMTGTYEVNPDCTGEAVYNFPEWLEAPPTGSKLVIVDNGREFYVVPTPPAPFVPSTTNFIYKRR
jgi:hypothetical protein